MGGIYAPPLFSFPFYKIFPHHVIWPFDSPPPGKIRRKTWNFFDYRSDPDPLFLEVDPDPDHNEADPKHWFQFYVSKTDDRVKHKGLYYYT